MNATVAFASVDDFDQMTLLVWSVVIFFMQAGFALLEAGAVESRLATNVLFKNVVDSTVVALSYWACGWALSFGQPASVFSGLGEFCLVGTPPSKYADFFFQFSFSATTATIVSGGTAGRIRILAYMMFCAFIGAVMHPLSTHWIWAPSGFLYFGGTNAVFGAGMIDFAGGVAVHVNAGASTLAAILVLGYRNQMSGDPKNPPRFERVANGKWTVNDLPVSSQSKVVLGTFILWFGFFAFNISSFVTFAGRVDLAGLVAINTALCSGAAAISSIFCAQLFRWKKENWKREKRGFSWSIEDVCNGTLTGLVVATSCCSVISPWAAVVAGVAAGAAYHGLARAMLALRLDDPVQAVPVHMGGGILSALVAALFAEEALVSRVFNARGGQVPLSWGLFMGGGALPLAGMVIGVLAVTGFSMICAGIFFGVLYLIDRRLGFRWFVMRSSVFSEDAILVGEDDGLPFSAGIADVTQNGLLVLSARTVRLDLDETSPALSTGKDGKQNWNKSSKAEKKMQRKQQHQEQKKLKEERKQRRKLEKKKKKDQEQQQIQQQHQNQREDEDIEMGSVRREFEETRIEM